MLERKPTSIPNTQIIQLKAPDRSLTKILKQMYQKSIKQSWIKDNHAKLYSPLIYDHLARISRNKRHSLHTLCCALQIYQNYCHSFRCDIQILKHSSKMIAEICLDISEDINQTKPDFNKNKNNIMKGQRMKYKLNILESLNWEINYTSFINICQILLGWLQLKLKMENYQYNFQSILEKQIQIMLEQFNFLSSSAFQSACKALSRVLQHFRLEITCQLTSIFNGTVENIQLNCIQNQFDNQLNNQNPTQKKISKKGKSWAEVLKMNFLPLQQSNKQILDISKNHNCNKKGPRTMLAELREKITSKKSQKNSLNYQPISNFSFCQSKQNNCFSSARTSICQ